MIRLKKNISVDSLAIYDYVDLFSDSTQFFLCSYTIDTLSSLPKPSGTVWNCLHASSIIIIVVIMTEDILTGDVLNSKKSALLDSTSATRIVVDEHEPDVGKQALFYFHNRILNTA